MNATRAVVITALSAGLSTAACSAGGQSPATVISFAPAAKPALTPDNAPASPNPALSIAPPTQNDPSGTPVDFALRYLNDLRAGDWVAALNEMAYVERAQVYLADRVDVVGLDVLRNASLGRGHLAPCTSANQLSTDAVIVRCGQQNVLVHVEARRGYRGVYVSDDFIFDVDPQQPHTVAYTHLV